MKISLYVLTILFCLSCNRSAGEEWPSYADIGERGSGFDCSGRDTVTLIL